MNYSKVLRTLRQKRFDYPEHLENRLQALLHNVKSKAILQEEKRPKTIEELKLAEKKYQQDYFKHL